MASGKLTRVSLLYNFTQPFGDCGRQNWSVSSGVKEQGPGGDVLSVAEVFPQSPDWTEGPWSSDQWMDLDGRRGPP